MAERSAVLGAVAGRGRLVGVMQSVVRPAEGRAWLGLFAVAAAARRQGVAAALFARVLEEWARAGIRQAEVLGVPSNYAAPGLDPRARAARAFLTRHGFRRIGAARSLVADLRSTEALDTAADERRLRVAGIRVRRARAADAGRVVAFAGARFGADWAHQAARALRLAPPGLHLALAGARILGFAAHSAMNREWGWFGPLGTAAEARGRGIGRVLLRRALRDLRAAGHRTAIIPWVATPAFYRRLVPCRAARVFWRYRRDARPATPGVTSL